VTDVESLAHLVLALGGFDRAVRMEEGEVELLLPQHVSVHMCMLTAAYATHSVQARYNFIIALLFFVTEDLDD
jgi:hypothetical protein